MSAPSPRSARPPGADWKDSYFSLDERFRQLQKKLNEKDEELKLLKVAQRKASQVRGKSISFAAPSASSSPPRGNTNNKSIYSSVTSSSPSRPSTGAASASAAPQPGTASNEYIAVPSVARPDAAAAALIQDAAAWGPSVALPDPAMVWGSEGSIRNYVAASALYHANEELRRKLNESSTVAQTLQQELSTTRSLSTKLQIRVDDLAQQMHQLVRERDLATQKLASAQKCVLDLEKTLKTRISEEDKIRFSFESQIVDLRSRLVIGADNNELLSRDVRALLAETKDRTGEVMSLRSKIALAESALSSQRNINENLLIELKSLNTQLIEERKRLLVVTRESQLSSLSRQQVADLEAQVRQLTEERTAVEREHTRLMGEFVNVTESALRSAKEEVHGDLEEWRLTAQHWERVSQLLYKDIAERTAAHVRCREECESAKTQRDTMAVDVRRAREEVQLCRAKLDIVWPSHDSDADGLSAEAVLATFRRRTGGSRPAVSKPSLSLEAVDGDTAATAAAEGATSEAALQDPALEGVPEDHTAASERIYELNEANAALVSDLERLRAANDLLQDRIDSLTGKERRHTADQEKAAREAEVREAAGRKLLDQQLERVQFLESQVRSLRGYHVSPTTQVDSVDPSENILELFLGQMVSANAPEGLDIPDMFSQVFGSVDFLLHETVTTPIITGFNGFFDTTISFCIGMDALLLYYLQTRELIVQLHRVRQEGEAHHQALTTTPKAPGEEASEAGTDLAVDLFETIAEGRVSLVDLVSCESRLQSDRPVLKGHVKFTDASGRHLASLEFQLTARAPFSDAFKALVRENHVEAVDDDKAEGEEEESKKAIGGGTALKHARDKEAAPSRSALQEWVHNNSSSSSSVVTEERLRPHHHHHQRRRRRPHAQQHGALQLIQTAAHASSDDLSSNSPLGPHGGAADEIIRMYPRSGSVAAPPSLQQSYEQQQQQHSFAHISSTLLSAGDTPGAPHRSLAAGGSAPGGAAAIHSVAVDVLRVELPADCPAPIPRLSCLYTVRALGREVRLDAPSAPQYTTEYSQADGARGTVFKVSSLAELAGLAREPVMFFLHDEDAGPGSGVWAMSLCEWTEVLHSPNRSHAFALPLHRRDAANGTSVAIRGAILRVRLSCATTPPQEGVHHAAARDVSSLSYNQPPQQHQPPQQQPSQQQPRHASPPTHPSRSDFVSPLEGPPSAVTALQRMLLHEQQQQQQQQQQPQQQQQQQPREALQPAQAHSAPAPAPAALGMEEMLMKMELERLGRRHY